MSVFYCDGCGHTRDGDEDGYHHDDEQDEDYCESCWIEREDADGYTAAEYRIDRADEANDEAWSQ